MTDHNASEHPTPEQKTSFPSPDMQAMAATWTRNLADYAKSTTSEAKLPNLERLVMNLARIIERSQQLVRRFISNQLDKDINFHIPDPDIVSKAFVELGRRMLAEPDTLVNAQIDFWRDWMMLWQTAIQQATGQTTEPFIKPDPNDKRFKDKAWSEIFIFDFIKQSYLLVARHLHRTVISVEGLDAKTAHKVDFFTQQFIDAMSPTNFAMTNPQVIKATLESGGENLLRGLANLLDDLERGEGKLRIKMSRPDVFELGVNIAVTPGKVIYQTELMQLIQYQPTTATVYQRPLLIIPPWINKFYILDLRPDNSFVRWATDQGFTVFVTSWVNPDERLQEVDFDTYISDGILAALDAITKATGESQINAIGYCIGGTLLCSTLAYLSVKNDHRIISATCLTTLLDFSDVGQMAVFVDEEQFHHVAKGMEIKGYLDSYHMAGVFNMLRANDLIWHFVINNYLMGKEPFPFDLLYWNADTTRMPKRMHRFYLRHMYLDNKLRVPGGIVLLGTRIDLGKIKVPMYFLSAKDDHIAPWKSTYANTHLVGGEVRFVLGASGHIAGVVNHPNAKKYNYWTNETLPYVPDEWLQSAIAHQGSWWPDWLAWIQTYAGSKTIPARIPGDGELTPIEDAPGSYVKVRSNI